MKQEYARSAAYNTETLLLHDDSSVGMLPMSALFLTTTRRPHALSGFFFKTRNTVSKSSRYLVK